MKKKHTGLKIVLIVLMLLFVAASALMVKLCIDLATDVPETAPAQSDDTITLPTRPAETTEATEAPTETTQPQPEHVVSTATIAAQGDLLMHAPVWRADYNTVCSTGNGTYDFTPIFKYLKPYTTGYDYALANLETTFGGDGYKYQGNPEFNTPDSFMDALVDTGYDMLLTANNHAADTRGDGILRTVETIRGAGLTALGTQLNDEEDKFVVAEINGIKVGMVCYTYGYSVNGDWTKFSLNGLAQIPYTGQVNFFMNNNTQKLYDAAQQHMEEMREAGAEATVFYIHWGVEYNIVENAKQNEIAQKLCDMGYDVIVGGHPHVVQPVELLTSTTNPDHKTICIYSLGNAVSNQRVGVSDLFPRAGYTEDGALFTVTFEKYSDGTVYVADADVMPTWVNKHSTSGKWEYNILPLDKEKEDQWQTMFEIPDATVNAAKKSYERTMSIVGEGLLQVKEHLEQEKLYRDAYYLEQVKGNG